MKTGSFMLLLLMGVAAAQPRGKSKNSFHKTLPLNYEPGHRHAEFHKKRDVIVTDYVTSVVTAPAAVVYVDPAGNVLYTDAAAPTPPPAAEPSPTPITDAQPAPVDQNAAPTVFDFPSIPAADPPSSDVPASQAPADSPQSPAAPPEAEPTPADNSEAATGPTPGPTGDNPDAPPDSSASEEGYGVAYAPYNDDGSCKTQDQVNQDFEAIKSYSVVRTYGVDCDQVSNVLNAAKTKNMQVFLGIFNLAPESQMNSDLQTLISAVNGDWTHVHSVSIGNEDVNQGKAQPADVVAATNSGRSQLRAAGYQGPVVHVDTFNQIIAHPELCEASDYAAANCHAFFDANVAAADAGSYVLKQAQSISAACGGKETWITESGWPHSGETNGLAVPSLENQQAALDSLRTSFKSNIFLFSAFDDLWKQNNAGTFGAEHYWGFLH